MQELQNHIKRINEKLQQLLKLHTSLQKENEKLQQQILSLKKGTVEKKQEIELLELRLEVLKASKGLMTEEEKKGFEKRINLYLKEIDKCFALLNQ